MSIHPDKTAQLVLDLVAARRSEATLLELWSNLDSYAESWDGLVLNDPESDFVQGVSYCLDDLRSALAASRRSEKGSQP